MSFEQFQNSEPEIQETEDSLKRSSIEGIEEFYKLVGIYTKESYPVYGCFNSFPPAAPIRITPYSQTAEELDRQLKASF